MKNLAKKASALLLALALLLSAASCSTGNPGSQGQGPVDTVAPSVQPSTAGEFPPTREEPLVLSMGMGSSGREDDTTMPLTNAFMEYIHEHTGGMVTIELYPDSQLGSENDMFDQVVAGSLDLAYLSASVLSTAFPEMSIYYMPFAFSSVGNFYEVCGIDGVNDGEFNKAMCQIVEDSGLCHMLSSYSAAFRGNHNSRRNILSVEDFQGLTYRVMAGEIFVDLYAALGASTATIAFSELYTSLQQKIVDGNDVGIAMALDYGFNEVQPYSTELNMVCCPTPMMISNTAWNKLTDAEKEIFYDACAVAESIAPGYQEQVISEYYDRAEELGMSIVHYNEIPEEGIQSMVDATQSVWEKYSGVCGSMYDILQKCIELAK